MSKTLSVRNQLDRDVRQLHKECETLQTKVRSIVARVSGKQKTWLPWRGCMFLEEANVDMIRAMRSLDAAANILGPMNSPHGKDVDPRKR